MGLGLPTDLHRFSRIFNFSTRQGNYELCIMDYELLSPTDCTDFKDFSQARKHIKVQDF